MRQGRCWCWCYWCWWCWDHSLAAVNNDVFRSNAAFQHAHLWMVTSSSEEAWRLDAEISNPLLVVVHDAETIFLEDPLILLFDFLKSVFRYGNAMRDSMMFSVWEESAWMQAYLFLRLWHLFPSFWLGLEVFTHVTEVTLVQVGDLWLLLWSHFLK